MRKVLFIFTLIILTSCSLNKEFTVTPIEEYESAYVGKTLTNVMDEFGAPISAYSDGNNGMIVVYEHKILEFTHQDDDENVSSNSSSYSATSSYDEESENTEQTETMGESSIVYKHFYFNKDNVCYRVDTNDYLKGGVYNKYFNRVAITEMSIIAVLITLFNIFFVN